MIIKYGLTELETRYLARFRAGMDEPDSGWLHEMADEGKTTSGVISSLEKKGLIDSTRDDEPGMPPAYWITVTDKGKEFVFSDEEISSVRHTIL